MAYVVTNKLCIACEACIPECFTECITMTPNTAVVDGNRCIECGACRYVCPTDAINPE